MLCSYYLCNCILEKGILVILTVQVKYFLCNGSSLVGEPVYFVMIIVDEESGAVGFEGVVCKGD